MASSVLHPAFLDPVKTDGLVTETSLEQAKTEGLLRELLSLYVAQPGTSKPPVLEIDELTLNRKAHVRWLSSMVSFTLPTPYTSLDASRPWLLYWVTHSLASLNVTLDNETKRRARETIRSFWNKEQGGFGGGPGQMAHLAPTYASVSALAYLVDGNGQSEEEQAEAWGWIDRQAVHDWLLSLKQPDGSFVMHKGGEVDVRGCYCALTTAVLLNILTPDLARGTSQFIASCQTYEGGLASASHSYSSPADSGFSPPTLGEAHGGYTFCALASYFALTASPSLSPPSSSTRGLDVSALLRWAAHMQGVPIEAGGFKGRSNKLVDGCYSWWCGGLFAILGALLPSTSSAQGMADLFNRTALQEYVLIAAQAEPHGGLRDKPGKGADAYHSCYNLAGLAAAQHCAVYEASTSTSRSAGSRSEGEGKMPEESVRAELERAWTTSSASATVRGKDESDSAADGRMRDVFVSALAWSHLEERKIVIGDSKNELVRSHPVYGLTMDALEKMLRWSYGQGPKVGLVEIA